MDEAIADQIVKFFSDFLTRGVKYREMPRKKLVREIYRYCIFMNLRNHAAFWKQADSDKHLKLWLMRQGQFTQNELLEFLKEGQQIPGLIRKALIETADALTPLSGGKPRALDLAERFKAQQRVQELTEKGTSHRKAYAQVANEMNKDVHAIRRACDPREAERSGYAMPKKRLVGLLHIPNQKK